MFSKELSSEAKFWFVVCVGIGRIPVVLRICGGGEELFVDDRLDSERREEVEDDAILARILSDDLGTLLI